MPKQDRMNQPFHIKFEAALKMLQKFVQTKYHKKAKFTYLPNTSIFDKNGKILEESYIKWDHVLKRDKEPFVYEKDGENVYIKYDQLK